MNTIRKATSEDIYFLSELINIAAKANWSDDYRKKVAEEVCSRDDVTYSWKNGLIAYTRMGNPLVAYLHMTGKSTRSILKILFMRLTLGAK